MAQSGNGWELDDNGMLTVSSDEAWENNRWSRENVRQVTVRDGVTKVGKEAFYYCGNLTAITLPPSVMSIEDGAFWDCGSLTGITLPQGMTRIGDWAFTCCHSMTGIIIPDSVTSIGNWAFNHCVLLTSITIPPNVTSIGNWAFENCSSLTGITIPPSVTSIGYKAFAFCKSLSFVVLPRHCTVGENAFYDCPAEIRYRSIAQSGDGWELYDDGTLFLFSDDAWKNSTWSGDGIQDIILGNGVTEIPENAFQEHSNLQSVTIPETVGQIGGYAFAFCGKLANVSFTGEQPKVDKLNSKTFKNCTSLTEIFLPDSVISLAEDAFEGCANLKKIDISPKYSFLYDCPAEIHRR